MNAIPAPIRTVIFLAVVGLLVVLAQRYISTFATKAGV